MYHFRKNVFPAASGPPSQPARNENPAGKSQQRNTAPEMMSAQRLRAPSSIHYNIVSPRDIATNSNLGQPRTRHETSAQIRKRKIQEYKAKKWEEKYGNTVRVTPTSSFEEGVAAKDGVLLDDGDISGGKRNTTNSDSVFRSKTADWHSDKEKVNVPPTGSDGFLLRPSASFEERAQVSRARADKLSELYAMTEAANDENASAASDRNSIFRPKSAAVSKAVESQGLGGIMRAKNKHEIAAEVRHRKIQEYKAKKHAAKYGGNINLSSSFDGVIMSHESIDGSVETSLKSHSFDYVGDRSADDTNGSGRVRRKNKHEIAAEVRQRKIQEYKAKKHAEAAAAMDSRLSLASSFDGVISSHDSVDGSVETSLRSYSFDHVSDRRAAAVGDFRIDPARSGALWLQPSPSFEEQTQFTRARADSSAMTTQPNMVEDDDAMNLNRHMILKENPAVSLSAALSTGMEAQKWAQDRSEESRRIRKGGVYVGQVTPSSSFDVLASELTASRSRSIDSYDHHHHHHHPPAQNGYLAANGVVYDVPSLC